MATVETLKNKNNETFYPVTKTEAVYNADGSENLSVTLTGIDAELDTKATISTDAADANKMMKADGTKALVGSSNIDFTTLRESENSSITGWGSSAIRVRRSGDWVQLTLFGTPNSVSATTTVGTTSFIPQQACKAYGIDTLGKGFFVSVQQNTGNIVFAPINGATMSNYLDISLVYYCPQ